jgi:hypothetical protein
LGTARGRLADVFGGVSLSRSLWPHQVRALAALDRDVARGDRATYLVVPPGGGKTLIGLEAARRLGRPTVVLCPNTAIQAQWMAQWQASFGPDAVPATASRELPTPLTVLTYQALCTLGAAGDGEEAGDRPGPRTRPSSRSERSTRSSTAGCPRRRPRYRGGTLAGPGRRRWRC